MVLMKRIVSAAALLAASALVLASCSSDTTDTEGLQITTSIYPLEYVAEQVGGDHVSVSSITPPGSDDHSLELSPRQVTDLEKVDLVITLSNYQPAMDDALGATDPARLIDAADHVDLLDWGGHDDHDHDHDHDEGEHGEDEHDDHGHSHVGADPHFWLDPMRMANLASPVAEELAQIDPDNADEYRANADAFIEQMEQLDADYTAGLAQCDSTTFIVSHEAFGYLSDSYGLDQQSIAGLEIDVEPSPRRVAEITDLIEESGVGVIFATSQSEMTLISALAEEAGIDVEILDASATQIDDTVDYEEIMRNNLAKLQNSLGCR